LQGHALNEWFEIPGTNLSSVEPVLDARQRGWTGPASKISTWQGAALKRTGSVYMLGACGGHADYAGNEVDAIALNVDKPAWVQLRPPTSSEFIIDGSEAYLDYSRSATHTYYAQQFSESTNRLLVMPAPGMAWSSLPKPPADWPYGSRRPQAFDYGRRVWMHPDTYSPMTLVSGADFTAALCAMHNGTGDIYYARTYDNRLWRFTPDTGEAVSVGSYSHGNYAGSAIDHTRNRMLVVGDYSGTVGPRVISTTNASPVSAIFGGMGGDALKMSGYPGVVFDESNDRFLVFKNTSPITVLSVNAIATKYAGNMHFMRVA